MYRVSSLPRYTDTPTVCTHLCFTFSTVRLQYLQKIGVPDKMSCFTKLVNFTHLRSVKFSCDLSLRRNWFLVLRFTRKSNQQECLAEHSALSLTILFKARPQSLLWEEVGPRTDDVSGLRDFRIPRVTCCPSHCLTLIKLLIADLSRRQYRRSSSISLQSHTYRGSIVLRLIDSYSLSPPRTAWTYTCTSCGTTTRVWDITNALTMSLLDHWNWRTSQGTNNSSTLLILTQNSATGRQPVPYWLAHWSSCARRTSAFSLSSPKRLLCQLYIIARETLHYRSRTLID